MPLPSLQLAGYVLAGGQSSRMGQPKALMPLAGQPLIAHAVSKLTRVCHSVSILTDDSALAPFAPLVPDLHPGCGPMSGMESALAHSAHDWNLILPVDVPFLPTALLEFWATNTLRHAAFSGTRISMWQVAGINQPAILMLHREVAPYLTASLASGDYKLGPALHRAAEALAAQHARTVIDVFRIWAFGPPASFERGDPDRPEPWRVPTEAQRKARDLWFTNLNTPEDFAQAEKHLDALDT